MELQHRRLCDDDGDDDDGGVPEGLRHPRLFSKCGFDNTVVILLIISLSRELLRTNLQP